MSQQAKEVLADIMKLIEDGELVRDISRDSRPDYYKRALNLIHVLKRARDILNQNSEK